MTRQFVMGDAPPSSPPRAGSYSNASRTDIISNGGGEGVLAATMDLG